MDTTSEYSTVGSNAKYEETGDMLPCLSLALGVTNLLVVGSGEGMVILQKVGGIQDAVKVERQNIFHVYFPKLFFCTFTHRVPSEIF